jgi:amidase
MSALPKLDIEPQKDWKEISRRKREQRESRLPKKWLIDLAEVPSEALDITRLYADKDWLTVDELTITGMSVVQLATAIKDRSYTALSVVLAFAHRAAIAQQLVNWYIYRYVTCSDR